MSNHSTFRFSDEELKKVNSFCAANNMSKSEFFRSAIKERLDYDSNWKLLYRNLSSTNKRLTRLENRITILTESFMLALETLMVFSPPVITEQQERVGAARLEGFFEDLKEELKKGGMLGQKLNDFIEKE